MALLDSMNLRRSGLHRLRPGAEVAQQADKRVCDVEGCATRLSRYNPAAVCSTHEGWDGPAGTTPVKRGTAAT